MEIDVKKVMPQTDGVYETVKAMVDAQSHLIEALHIMMSAIEYNSPDYTELHVKRMSAFVSRFTK